MSSVSGSCRFQRPTLVVVVVVVVVVVIVVVVQQCKYDEDACYYRVGSFGLNTSN